MMLSKFFEAGNDWVDCHCDGFNRWFTEEFKYEHHSKTKNRWRRFAFNFFYGLECGFPICCVLEYSIREFIDPCVAQWARVCWKHGHPWGEWSFVGNQSWTKEFEEWVPCWFHQLSIRPHQWVQHEFEYTFSE